MPSGYKPEAGPVRFLNENQLRFSDVAERSGADRLCSEEYKAKRPGRALDSICLLPTGGASRYLLHDVFNG